MKLRTEMQNGCVHANGYCVDEDAVDIRQAERLVHDAAAAHAYKRELADMRKAAEENPLTHERQLVSNLLDVLDRRAESIMAGWGFDSGEVE